MECSPQGQALHPVQGILPPCIIPIPCPSLLLILFSALDSQQSKRPSKPSHVSFSFHPQSMVYPNHVETSFHIIQLLNWLKRGFPWRLKTQNFIWPVFPQCPEDPDGLLFSQEHSIFHRLEKGQLPVVQSFPNFSALRSQYRLGFVMKYNLYGLFVQE